jgi:hypothetical protein
MSCDKEPITTYTLPKQSLVIATIKQTQTLTWHLPEHWIQKENTAFRKASDDLLHPSIKEKGLNSDFSIISFPGKAGDIPSNINRWRGQLELEPLTENDINQNLSTLPHEHLTIFYYKLDSKKPLLNSMYYSSIIVAFFDFNNETYFIKLSGESSAIKAQEKEFLNVIQDHLHVE